MDLRRLEPATPPNLDEYETAAHLLGGHKVEREVLFRLVGRPQRYGDLKPALRGQNDTALTRALSRLTDDWGLVDRRTEIKGGREIDLYEINALGIHVLFLLDRLRPVQETAQLTKAYLEAQRAAAHT